MPLKWKVFETTIENGLFAPIKDKILYLPNISNELIYGHLNNK